MPQHLHALHDISTDDHMTLMKKHPSRLSLFQHFCPNDEPHKYSNTIEFYDAIPKYFSNKRQLAALREGPEGREIYLPTIEREFTYQGSTYIVQINPARAEDRHGNMKEYYPSEQEELVEEALKKIACARLNGVYLEQSAGVQFTMYELKQELRKWGHSIGHNDLKRSLLICRRTGIAIKSKGETKAILDANILPVVLISSRKEWEDNPNNTYCYAQFNPLITRSMNALTYRQFDYETFMSYRYQLSRWFHKRLAHQFTQASVLNTYHILMSTIISDSGLLNAKRTNDRRRLVGQCLSELVDKNAIYSFDQEERRSQGRRIEDILYTLKPTMDFVSEIKRANRRANENQKSIISGK